MSEREREKLYRDLHSAGYVAIVVLSEVLAIIPSFLVCEFVLDLEPLSTTLLCCLNIMLYILLMITTIVLIRVLSYATTNRRRNEV